MSVIHLPLQLLPMPVQCVVLSTVLDVFLTRDAALRPLLDDLEGRIYQVHVADLERDFYLGFKRGRPWVHPSCSLPADVRIDATVAGFARLCFGPEEPDDLVFQRVLKLSGDSDAMLRFKKLLAKADIDWERELRAAFGEFFGRRVATAALALIASEQKLEESARSGLDSMLQAMNIPGKERLGDWQAGVEELTRRTHRLHGRIERLAARSRPERNP